MSMLWALFISALGVLALAFWAKSRGLSARWWEWTIGGVGVFVLFFAIENYIESLAEFEPLAAQYIILIFGAAALVLIILSALLIWRRNRVRAG